jgi:hypothetical protein
MAIYDTDTQKKNLFWYLPRPKPDHYKGGMPLHAERWCLQLARDILNKQDATILNLFCGMNQEGFRVDIKPDVNPDLVCDAHELTKHITQTFDIIFADPPYSNEEAEEIYGTPKLNYSKWTSEATQLLNDRGLLVVYHKYVMPNPNPEIYVVAKRVAIANRTWHLPRVAIYFQKKAAEMIDIEES